MPQASSKEVERAVYFCQMLLDGKKAEGATERIASYLPSVESLAFKFGERYVGEPEDAHWSCLWVHRQTLPVHLTVAWLTDKDLPRTEERGRMSELELRAGQHLSHPAHMVLFEKGILGYEYWKPAPRPWVLAEWFNTRLFAAAKEKPPTVSFAHLPKTDVLTDILAGRPIRDIHLRIPVTLSAALSKANIPLGQSVELLQKLGEEFTVGLELRPAARRRQPLEMLKKIVPPVAREARAMALEKLDVTIYDEDEEAVTLNLLHPKLMQDRKMVLLGKGSKAVEAESAYEAIEKSYKQLREAILDAAGYNTQ